MADLIRIVTKATNSFLDVNTITLDNWTFKLFYKVTVTLLVTCSVIVASKQFFGGPISCDAGPAKSGLNDEVLKSYCWMYANFKIPSTYQGPCSASGLDPKDEESPIYNSYYQWVSLFLIGLSILFYAPRGLWILMEGGLMKLFCMGTSSKLIEDSEEKKEKLMKYFSRNIENRFRVYFMGFIFCQFLNLSIVISAICLTHVFLHHRFFAYGIKVWNYYQLPYEEQEKSNPMCYTFPRIASCVYFRYGGGGGQEKINALCILGLNIVNDKVFLILWWWFFILVFLCCVELVLCSVQVYSPKCRYHLIRLRMQRFFRQNSKTAIIKNYIFQCGSGDWFVLYQMSKNLNRTFFMEFLTELSHHSLETTRSIGHGLEEVDVGGGSIVDLFLQPNLEQDEENKEENDPDEDIK